jgi:uncharacterized protein (TIGR03435 family)
MLEFAWKQRLQPRLWLVVAGLATLVIPIMLGIASAPEGYAQIGTVTQPPVAGEEKLTFEVASVKQNKSDGKSGMNVDPTPGDDFSPTGGLYSAQNVVLAQYIAFAYKLTNKQLQSMVSQVPWTTVDRFDIEARAEGNPTKDQYRAMMRSLLADRFRLGVHFETRQVPVYALMLAKPGILGPQLRLHQADDPLCSPPPTVIAGADAVSISKPAESDKFPDKCGGIRGMKTSAPGRMRRGGRDVSMALITSILAGVGVVDRPMVDETGLKGTVDFSLEWIQLAANVVAGAEFHPDESAPSFDQAMKEQLGIRMVSEKGPVEFFVVDHLEHPSPN